MRSQHSAQCAVQRSCTWSAIHACSARLVERHTLTMRYGYCIQTVSQWNSEQRAGQLAGAGPDQPLAAALCRLHCGARRRSTSSKICAPPGHDPAKAIARGILVGHGTSRCRWRPISRNPSVPLRAPRQQHRATCGPLPCGRLFRLRASLTLFRLFRLFRSSLFETKEAHL